MTRRSDLRIAAFRPEHLEALDLQRAQAFSREHLTQPYLLELATTGPAFTVFAGETPIFCGGLREYGPERGILWAMISRDAGRHFVALHRRTRALIREWAKERDLFTACQAGFGAGARWLEMLGFTRVCALGPYGPAGVPHDLYRREG